MGRTFKTKRVFALLQRKRAPCPFKIPPSDLSVDEDIERRLEACRVGLPATCTSRACRRLDLCIGPDAHCLDDHQGLMRWYRDVISQEDEWGPPPWS